MHAFKVIFDPVLVNKGKYFPGPMPITLSENYIKSNLNKQNALEVINTVSGGVVTPKIGVVHSTITPIFLNKLVSEAQKTSTNMAKDILYHQNTIKKGNCAYLIKIHSEEDRFFLSTGLGISKALGVRRVVNESVCTHSGTVLITNQFGIVHRETTEYVGMFELSNGSQNLDIRSRIRIALVIRFDAHLVNDPRFKITKQKHY